MPSAFLHDVGDVLQLVPNTPPMTVVARTNGGFGAVYILESRSSGWLSAAKTPRADLQHSNVVLELFAAEAQTWLGLPRHPCILEIYKVWQHNGRPYVHMEYIPPINQFGASADALLAGLSQGFKLNVSTVSTMLANLLSALDFLEDEDPSFFHGDIKPSNLLLRVPPGKPLLGTNLTELRTLLTDFGLSRAATSAAAPDVIAGDLRYLAPELLQEGEHRLRAYDGRHRYWSGARPSKKADIYAIGCTAFELAIGVPRQLVDPVDHSITWALGNRLSAEAVLRVRPDLGRSLAEWISKCLSPDPADRPDSFHELLTSLVEAVQASGGRAVTHRHRGGGEANEIYREVESTEFYQYLVDHRNLEPNEARGVCLNLQMASSLRASGHLRQAKSLIENVLSTVEHFPPAIASLAHIFLAADMHEQSVSHYLKAIELYRGDPVLQQVDRLGFGASCSTVAQIISDPASPSFQPQLSLDLARTGLRLLPSEARAYLTTGVAELSCGRIQPAKELFYRGLEIDPSNRQLALFVVVCDLLDDNEPFRAEPYGPELSESERHFVTEVARKLRPLIKT